MSVFPYFSNVDKHIVEELELRKDNNQYLSSLTPWVRITSAAFAKEGQGTERGMIMYSNPDFKLFTAAGDDPSIYGNDRLAGTLGKDFNGDRVGITEGQGYRPSPVISSMQIQEGEGDLSRKLSFSVTAHTRQQMEEVVKYFLEPGYTLFVEWGWNTEKSLRGFEDIPSIRNIGKYQSFKYTAERQVNTEGHYSNYLGYITGGDISITGDEWEISVELTGFAYLPAYLTTNDKPTLISTENSDVEDFGEFDITNAKSVGLRRFMTMFNELPQNRKLPSIKRLAEDLEVTRAENFINFDIDIRSAVKDKIKNLTIEVGNGVVNIPDGVDIVKPNRYIRFGTLMRIINDGISVKGYKLGDEIFNFRIETEKCPVYAFPNIYSTDEDTLFIPNEKTPRFSFNEFSNSTKVENMLSSGAEVSETVNNSVGEFKFPEIDNNEPIEEIRYKNSNGIFRKVGRKDGSRWGYLNNLYVDFDFAMDILGTKTMFIKESLYQILNGMSEAVNGVWDFQLVEQEQNGTTILSVVEMNFTPEEEMKPEPSSLVLNTIGTDSVLKNSSFSLNLSGATMNTIIGERNSVSINTDTKKVPTIFDTNLRDKILSEIDRREAEQKESSNSSTLSDEEIERNKEIVKAFTKKLKLVPKSEFQLEDIKAADNIDDIFDLCYLSAYNNGTIFSILKGGNDKVDSSPAPLMPIEFSFTVHGISGFKRGDKFYVDGLPKKYQDSFFQIVSVQHTISNMDWDTEITGKLRAQ